MRTNYILDWIHLTVILLCHFRIGSEKRDIFGNEIKSSVAPGPGVYDVEKGQKFVKGKFSPKITMGYRYDDKSHINPVHKPGPGAYEPSFVAH
jgi:hypothetical protein